jgi:hypothetical protein
MLAGAALIVAMAGAPTPARAAVVVLAPSKDNTLYESETGFLSNGAGSGFFVGRTQSGVARRAVVAFDVAGAIPAGSTINSVELGLELTMSSFAPAAQDLALHRLLADWGEGASNADALSGGGGGAPAQAGDATWLHRFFNTVAWSGPAAEGDYVGTPSATRSVDALGPYSWGPTARLRADVQGWLDDPPSNSGWILIGDEVSAGSAKRFASREGTIPPRLAIEFVPECRSPLAASSALGVLSAVSWRRRRRSRNCLTSRGD